MRSIDQVTSSGPLISVGPRTLVADAARMMSERAISHVLVIDGSSLLGVACVCDLDGAGTNAEIGGCMSAPPVVIDAGASVFEAARLMIEQGVSCLPVMRAGGVVGVVTASDLRRAGVLTRSPSRCAACGSGDHVRSACADGVGFCFECERRSEPPGWDEDTGTAD